MGFHRYICSYLEVIPKIVVSVQWKKMEMYSCMSYIRSSYNRAHPEDQPEAKYLLREFPTITPPPLIRSRAISGAVFWVSALPGGECWQSGYRSYPWVKEGMSWTNSCIYDRALPCVGSAGQAAAAKGQEPTVLCLDLHTWIHGKGPDFPTQALHALSLSSRQVFK